MKNTYTESLRSLHAAVSDYLLLIGEPQPLSCQLCLSFVEFIGTLPPGEEFQASSLDNFTSAILEAAILGIKDRLDGLRPSSDVCLQSITDCLKVTESLDIGSRCEVFFKVLGIAIAGLADITHKEYPQLTDGSGKKLGK